ncbi:MAG: sulfatase-like hydrolase/transferase [Saprospiraceae bacterium]
MDKLKAYSQILYPLFLRLGLVYFFYSLTRIVFYLLNKNTLGAVDMHEWLRLLWGGLVFDTSAIAYTNALCILAWVLPVRPLLTNKTYQSIWSGFFLFMNISCLILNMIDFAYYEFNLKRMTADFSHWVGESNTLKIITNFLFTHWFFTIICILFLAAFVYLFTKIKKPDYSSVKGFSFYAFHITLLGILSGLLIGGMRGGFLHSTRPITISNAGQYVSNASHMPIVLNTPFSLIRTIDKKVFKEENYFSDDRAKSIFNPEVSMSDSPDSAQYKNIVIILLESFSREHSAYLNPDLYKPGEGYTPFMDSLMQEGMVCTNAFANGRKSIDAMPSVLASLPSLEVPYVLSHNSLDKINSIASLLKPNGYYSAFFHGAPNGSMGFQAFSKIAGFDAYYGKDEFNDDQYYDGIWGIWDEEFFQYFGKTMTSFKQPFIGVCFSVSSHHPFEVPARYKGRFKKGPLQVHECVGYTDYSIRRFFEYASTQSWYSNTLFVITADHSTVAWSDKYNTSTGAFAIPIIYFDPGSQLKGKYEPVTQQIDIMPSIIDYLHLDKSFVAFGKSVFDPNSTRFAYNFINEHYQMIDANQHLSYFDGNKVTHIYDLQKGWNNNVNLLGTDVARDSSTLWFHQAFIQQYNHRILQDQLTITK